MSLNPTEAPISTFQREMYRQVIADHEQATEHSAYCCGIVASYREILGHQSVQAPVMPQMSVSTASVGKLATDAQQRYVRGLMAKREISRTEMQTWGAMLEVGLTFEQADMIIKLMKDRPAADRRTQPRMATIPQIQYIKDLMEIRQWDGPVNLDELTFVEAGQLIDGLKKSPRKPQGAAVASGAEEGVYFFDGTYVKVQAAVHGSGRLYTKVFDPQTESWERKGGYLRKLKPEHKLTAEQAAQFGHLYGQCVNCHRVLTKEDSIERGYGDKCAEKNGWPY